MTKRKPFSILKWLVFPSLTLALASTIAWFNISAFGWQDGAVYLAIVAVITWFSIAINKYVKLIDDDDESNDRLAIAAFVFEIVLTLILAINAAYSLSIQREMSIARQAEAHQSQDLETVSKLKDRRAQREAARMLRERSQGARSSQAIFAENERLLFWIMAGEMLVYIVAAFTLYAVSSLTRPNRKPVTTSPQAGYLPDDDFPDEFDDVDVIEKRSPSRRQNLTTPASKDTSVLTEKKDTAKTHVSFDPGRTAEGLRKLRECLRDISFRLAGVSFKADVKTDCVWIRAMQANQGTQETISSAKAQLSILDDALTMPSAAFRNRLEQFLKKRGFEI